MANLAAAVRRAFGTLARKFDTAAAKELKCVIQFDLAGEGGAKYQVSIEVFPQSA